MFHTDTHQLDRAAVAAEDVQYGGDCTRPVRIGAGEPCQRALHDPAHNRRVFGPQARDVQPRDASVVHLHALARHGSCQ